MATGNVHIKEKMSLDIQVSKMKLLKASHVNQKYRLETDIARKYPAEIQAVKRRIAALEGDWESAAQVLERKDAFAMTVDGVLYTERKEAGMALLAACAGIRGSGVPVQVGHFQGFRLSVGFDGFNQQYLMTVSREENYKMEMGGDPLENLKRLGNLLAGIEGEIPKAKQKLETLNRQLAAAQEEVGKPFPKEKELSGMLERLAELNAMLNMDQDEEAPVAEREEDVAGNPEFECKAGSWTLRKIKEMQKRQSDGSEIARHSIKPKEINGPGRMRDGMNG